MRIIKCDLCKKEIKKGDLEIVAGTAGFLSQNSFCATCGIPVINFLKKNNLISAADPKTKKNNKIANLAF